MITKLFFLWSVVWPYLLSLGFPGNSVVSNAGDGGLILVWEDPLKKEMATHSSIIAWRIPWTEKPGGLQSRGVAKESDTTEGLTLCVCYSAVSESAIYTNISPFLRDFLPISVTTECWVEFPVLYSWFSLVQGWSLGRDDSLEKGMATHSNILA